jgi:uncharacterized protein YrrD
MKGAKAMYKVNNLLGKTIINQTSGERVATVSDVVFSENMRTIIAILTEGSGWFSGACSIRWEGVISIGDVVVMRGDDAVSRLKDDALVRELHERAHRITGTPLISQSGERMGAVDDVLIIANGEVVGYEIKNGLFSGGKFLPVEKIVSVGKDAVITHTSDLAPIREVEQMT